MKLKDALLLIVLLTAAVVVGGLIASLTKDVGALSWLSYSQALGISPDKPFTANLMVLQLSFGLQLKLNVAQVICLIVSAFCFKKFK